ncbi:MAG: T9SS type A sorting domain-containing protein, partial [Gemmatimonadetes bacterium]|nr:T9SS type A sorting domain-containing protein [Gemmatimonadota bacterium]
SESASAISLFRNDGDARFTDVTPAVFRERDLVYAVNWVDYDRDGDLDVSFASRNGGRLFRNDGPDGFRDRTVPPFNQFIWSLKWSDWDLDGDPDAFLGTAQAPLLLARNDGDGRFREVAQGSLGRNRGTDGAFSGDFADMDRDGDIDFYVTYFFGPAQLFRNDGPNVWTESTPRILEGTGAAYTGLWSDYDLDGDPDLLRCSFQPGSTALYRNDGFDFADVSGLLGPSVQDTVWTGVWGDHDVDGREDLYLGFDGAVPDRLLLNENGGGRRWLSVRPVGTLSNRSGIGARVTVTDGPRSYSREISGGGDGWCSQRPAVATFGVEASATVTVEVLWPSGQRQVIAPVETNQAIVVTERGLEPVTESVPSGPEFDFNLDLRGTRVSFARLHVRAARSDDQFTALALNEIGGRLLRARLPAGLVPPQGLEYWVEYRLLNGSPRRTPRVGEVFVPAEFASEAAPEPLLPRRFALFGFPFVPEAGTVQEWLTDDLGPVDPDEWKLGRWDPDSGKYRTAEDSTLALSTGEAFWIVARDGGTPTAGGRSSDPEAGAVLSLRPGWNQVAHPFAFPVDLAVLNFDAAPNVTRRIVEYRAGGYADVTRLEPWRGYWMFNGAFAGQTVHVPGVPATGEPAPLPRRSPGAGEWSLRIDAVQGGASDVGNEAGTRRGAETVVDAGDRREPPPVPEGVSAYFEAPAGEGLVPLTADYRPSGSDGHVWNLVVGSTSAEAAVQIRADGVSGIPADHRVWLVPEATGARIDLREAPELRVPGGRPHRFRLVVGTPDFAEEAYATGGATAGTLSLGLPWPNPARSEASLAVTLPVDGPVRVTVHDVAGRRIRTLWDGPRQAGRGEIAWDTADEQGHPVPSGIYFVRLRAGDRDTSRKLLVRR